MRGHKCSDINKTIPILNYWTHVLRAIGKNIPSARVHVGAFHIHVTEEQAYRIWAWYLGKKQIMQVKLYVRESLSIKYLYRSAVPMAGVIMCMHANADLRKNCFRECSWMMESDRHGHVTFLIMCFNPFSTRPRQNVVWYYIILD